MDNNNVTPDFTEPTPDVTPDYSSQDFSTPDYASEEASNPFSGIPETVTPVVETVETTIIEPEPIYQPTGDTTTNSTYSDTYTQTYDQSTYAVEGVDEKKNDGFSIASLVLGILSLLCCCIPYANCIEVVICILAIVFGAVSKKNSDGKKSPFAIAGLVCGIIGLVLYIVLIIIGIAFYGVNGLSELSNYSNYDSLY